MKITNKHKLPAALVRAVERDKYDPGKSDITVTQLTDSPRIRVLMKRHADELEQDVSEMIWALFGSAVHEILDKAADTKAVISETRVYITVNGWKLGGQLDALEVEKGILQDYKTCKAYAVVYGPKPEWTAQLNVLKRMIEKQRAKKWKIPITRLQNICLIRDFNKFDAMKNPDYPQAEVCTVTIHRWTSAEADRYIKERMALHKAAEKKLPRCTDHERWARPSKYAVMKRGRKTAIRGGVCDSKAEAQKVLKGVGSKDHFIEHRPGQYIRCQDWCPVRKFCSMRTEAS